MNILWGDVRRNIGNPLWLGVPFAFVKCHTRGPPFVASYMRRRGFAVQFTMRIGLLSRDPATHHVAASFFGEWQITIDQRMMVVGWLSPELVISYVKKKKKKKMCCSNCSSHLMCLRSQPRGPSCFVGASWRFEIESRRALRAAGQKKDGAADCPE